MGYHLTTVDDVQPSGSVAKSPRVIKKPTRGPIFNWVLSTKYTDPETGLVYYGYRFYQPENGRWASRDPLGELGGRNLSAFLMNKPVNKRDILGLTNDVGDYGWPAFPVPPELEPAKPRVQPSPDGGAGVNLVVNASGHLLGQVVTGSVSGGASGTAQALTKLILDIVIVAYLPVTDGIEEATMSLLFGTKWYGMDTHASNGAACRRRNICRAKCSALCHTWDVEWQEGWLYGRVNSTLRNNDVTALEDPLERNSAWIDAYCDITDEVQARGRARCQSANVPCNK